MRCLALAESFARSGWQCQFAVADGTCDAAPQLQQSKHRVVSFGGSGWNEPAALIETAAGRSCDLLVIDHYGLGADYERRCRSWTDTIVVLDDLADRRHDCDVLADAANHDGSRYEGLLPPECKILSGPSYALLSSWFIALRSAALRRRTAEPVDRILVAFGGTDPGNLTISALEAIVQQERTVSVDVVLGPASQNLDTVRAYAENQGVELHIGSDDMAGLMARADLAIGAAGVTAWERCCLGLPAIAIAVAPNQALTAARLKAAGAATVLEENSLQTTLPSAVADLMANSEARVAMSHRAAALCDGRGADRLRLAAASGIAANDGASVTLRPATASDTDRMFAWQSDSRTRRFARNPEVPDYETHRRWVAARLADTDCLLNIVEHGGTPAGVVRLDRGTPNCGTVPAWEISILVAPDRYGKGIGGGALDLARQLVSEDEFVAEVLPGNDASHALFRKAGYVWREGLYWRAPLMTLSEGTCP